MGISHQGRTVLVRGLIVVVLIGVILGVPYLLRPPEAGLGPDALTLTALSPHNEAILFEFENAFGRWHHEHYGRPVRIDWRMIGGTSIITRYLAAEYVASFRAHWTRQLGRRWTGEIESGFANPRIDPARPDPNTPRDVVEARRAFLESNVGVGVDLFFGGGWFDHDKQARAGNLVPCGLAKEHPELLRPEIMPRTASGEILYDDRDRFYGTCLTCFGICYNDDVLKRLAIPRRPAQWADLADPRLFGEVGLADPTKSGSSCKAFEMLIQQQMALEIRERCQRAKAAQLDKAAVAAAVGDGFWRGMRLIQRIAANSRYFTNIAPKVPVDVVQGNTAAGMCIDFFGRFEAGMVARPDGTSRMGYVSPVGGTSVSMDPVGMLRGAPHPELARRFIYFCLTIDGQKLWDYRVGAPGGPVKYALRRPPIRRDMYRPEHLRWSSDPDVNLYELASAFTYEPKWTAPLFDFIRLMTRTMCIDTHRELTAAWSAILAAGGPEACPEAVARMQQMPLTYPQAFKTNLRDKLAAVEAARGWTLFFRDNYVAARRLAEQRGTGR
jgi:iron(III) transport system substrate-binding protein